MSEANGGQPGRRPLSVYAVIERRDGVRPYWMKLGAAFTNRDGSLTLILDAFPWSTNRLLVREPRAPEGRSPEEEAAEVEGAP